MKHAALCIAGAHRSGTSMLTRLLHQCGLDLGPESELMPARSDNPDGFWENLRFVAINDEVLNKLGGAWDLPPQSSENFRDKRLDPLRTKARLLLEQFASKESWGWKDPRNSLTLPFWQSLLPDLKVILVVRNPLEVAYSMRERNGTSYAFGLRLWEIYNRRALEFSGKSKRIVTLYDSFFENPETELKRIATFAGLSQGQLAEVAKLVVRKKRHTQFDLNRLIDAGSSAEIVELYRALIAEASRPDRQIVLEASSDEGSKRGEMSIGARSQLNFSVPDSEAVRRELAELRGAQIENRVALAERDGRIREMEKNAARQEQHVRELRTDLGRRDAELGELRIELGRRNAELGELRIELVRRDAELGELRTELGRRDAELEMIRERFMQTNQLLHNNSISLAEQERRVVELTSDLRRQLYATKRLLRLLDDTEAAARRLRSSRRWKIANPFGTLKALFGSHDSLGYGHLDKVVKEYLRWRELHPEADSIADALQALNPRADTTAVSPPDGQTETRREPKVPTEPIEFTTYEEVEFSIIIPVYNQFHFTLSCLASIQEHRGAERFEVIVIDDCSTDATSDVIAKVPGLVYLRNESNCGFVRSCNLGAEKARGEFLVFLNNDTQVTPDWLRALRETFDFEPEAGLVGSKLIFPDGRLQEAGGIIWRDGSGWNRGKFQDPSQPEFNYLRETDYCSAACMMIPTALFRTLGGFDSKYVPCYYEDTDLAFRVRRHGLKVLYQPTSEVIHYEGATGGTDLSSGAKKYQEVNRETFVKAWAAVLADKPENGDVAAYERLKPGQKRILVIDHHLPMPDRDSGSLRMSQILKILYRLGHRVTFVPDNMADVSPYSEDLRRCGIKVVTHPYAKTVREYLECEGATLDIAILSRCDFASKHINDVRLCAPQSRVIFDTVDLHFVRTNREAELMRDEQRRLTARETEVREYALIDEADETWVVSESERQFLRRERPNKSIAVVSNIVDAPGSTTPFSLRRDFLFIGSFQHPPNVDAVLFFMREVYPLLQTQLSQANFYIIGDKAPPEVIGFASERVIVTGLQPDVQPYFDSVKLSIAPLRYGAGVKGKINQSMGLGVPVVATSIAVEGMDLVNEEDVLIADTPEHFAQAMVELYENEELWTRISKSGVDKTNAMYSCARATEQLSRLFNEEHLRSTPTRERIPADVVRGPELEIGTAR